jgi:L-lactate dehydrogenase complex protein LldG
MNAREEMLARIRNALADQPTPAPIERSYRAADDSDSGSDALLELLVDRLIDYKATVHRATPATAAAVIAAALSEREVTKVVIPEGFPSSLLTTVPSAAVIHDDPVLSAAELDALDGVLTTSTVAIAETGTIVLDAGPGQGRRALTLVPDYHLCVVRAADVVRGVPEGIQRLGTRNAPSVGNNRPLTWISGPSATSDIELQRVEGVHGPRTLAVVLISEDRAARSLPRPVPATASPVASGAVDGGRARRTPTTAPARPSRPSPSD